MSAALVSQVMRFGCTGAVGFLVDGGLLFLLIENGADAYLARLISFPMAVVCTFAMNRAWTFGQRG
ncbi:MAG: GtrA family protein, partial [Pseudomonadota bacterium]